MYVLYPDLRYLIRSLLKGLNIHEIVDEVYSVTQTINADVPLGCIRSLILLLLQSMTFIRPPINSFADDNTI